MSVIEKFIRTGVVMGVDKSDLGSRMKLYEKQHSGRLLPLIPLCARVDGRAFHTFTRDLERPYDERLTELMIATTRFLVESTGALIGYTQSDEISLIWYTDNFKSMVFFDSKILKMTSILSSMTSVYFNKRLPEFLPEKTGSMPLFDARVWNVPNLAEATNYMIWREADATRNSISMAAQSMFSHTSLHKKNTSEMQEMMFNKHGVNWNDYPSSFKRGTYVRRSIIDRAFDPNKDQDLPPKHHARTNPSLLISRSEISILEIPPLRRLANRQGVLFHMEAPIQRTEELVA